MPYAFEGACLLLSFGVIRAGTTVSPRGYYHEKSSCSIMSEKPWAIQSPNIGTPWLEAHAWLRLDETQWIHYKAREHKRSARQHIVAVTHTKAQNAIGKGTFDCDWHLFLFDHNSTSFQGRAGWMTSNQTLFRLGIGLVKSLKNSMKMIVFSLPQDRWEIHGKDLLCESGWGRVEHTECDSWLNQAAGEQQAVGLWALKNPTY